MIKANFIRKYYGTGYERNFLFMDYEYKGYEYTVYENRAKGSEPLAWQHKSHQADIDKLIESKKKNNSTESAEIGLDLFMKITE